MTSLELMKVKGLPLPPIETEDGLTAQDIMNKIRSFYRRFEKWNDPNDMGFMEAEFLGLLLHYPKSMCNRHMTETMKQLIAIFYFESKPECEVQDNDGEGKKSKDSDVWKGYSYEDLAVMFDMSKATVHEAIRQKEAEIKKLLSEVKLRGEAKAIALRELVEQEKLKLLEQNNQKDKQTTEQTLT